MSYNKHSIYSIILCTLWSPLTLYPISFDELTINLNSQEIARLGRDYGLQYKQPSVDYKYHEKHPVTTPTTTTTPKAIRFTGSGGDTSGSGSDSGSGFCASPEITIMCDFNDNELSPGHSPVATGASLSRYIWKDSIIPFIFDANVTRNDRTFFYRLMTQIMSKSCFRFEQLHPGPEPSIHHLAIIVGAPSCNERKIKAWVEAPSETKVILVSDHQLADQPGCNREGIILHEFFHVFGIGHTHRRPDRDSYINVHEENIIPVGVGHYSICSDCILYGGVPYECNSIMHFGYGRFSKDALIKPTMTAVDPSTCVLCHNGPLNPSDTDWGMVNILSGSSCQREDNQVIWWDVIHEHPHGHQHQVNHHHHHQNNRILDKDKHNYHQANHHHHHHQLCKKVCYRQANYHQANYHQQQVMVPVPVDYQYQANHHQYQINHNYYQDNHNYHQANYQPRQVLNQEKMVILPEETVLLPVRLQHHQHQGNQHHYQIKHNYYQNNYNYHPANQYHRQVLVPVPVDHQYQANQPHYQIKHNYHQVNHYHHHQVMAQKKMVLIREETVVQPLLCKMVCYQVNNIHHHHHHQVTVGAVAVDISTDTTKQTTDTTKQKTDTTKQTTDTTKQTTDTTKQITEATQDTTTQIAPLTYDEDQYIYLTSPQPPPG